MQYMTTELTLARAPLLCIVVEVCANSKDHSTKDSQHHQSRPPPTCQDLVLELLGSPVSFARHSFLYFLLWGQAPSNLPSVMKIIKDLRVLGERPGVGVDDT